jgi:hypothetical protein
VGIPGPGTGWGRRGGSRGLKKLQWRSTVCRRGEERTLDAYRFCLGGWSESLHEAELRHWTRCHCWVGQAVVMGDDGEKEDKRSVSERLTWKCPPDLLMGHSMDTC